MLLAVIFCLGICAVSSTRVQPPRCPKPTKSDCIPTCAEPNPQNCNYNSKYACEGGFVLSKKGGKCVKIEDCPQDLGCNGDKNAVIKSCPSPCPLTCDSPEQKPCSKLCLQMGCACKSGFILDKIGGKCVETDKCPGTSIPDCIPTCAEPNPQNCNYNSQYACEGGFVLSKKGGKCVKIEDCPQDFGCNGDKDAVIKSCPSPCPLTCDSPEQKPCSQLCLQMGCACKSGFILDKIGGKCVETDKCPGTSKPDCIPTCAEPNPQNCNYNSQYPCEGDLVLSKKGGECIRIQDCPQDLGCNGDKHAVIKSCPPPCPSTCDSPNEIPCYRACLRLGCACKPGFILTENGGKCIEPDKCPGSNPCGKNSTFSSCTSRCPDTFCPKDDSRLEPCDLPDPCQSGCVCNLGYRRTNTEDAGCILAEECPAIECTRCNEIWNSCPSACLAEECADINNQPTTCNTLVHNCYPGCICDEGYFRNSSNICIPAADCPGQCSGDENSD